MRVEYPSRNFVSSAFRAIRRDRALDIVIRSESKRRLVAPELPFICRDEAVGGSIRRWWRLFGFMSVHFDAQGAGLQARAENGEGALVISYLPASRH